MPDTSPKPPSEAPLCIRFRVGQREQVAARAAQDGKQQSTWIRDLVVARADQVLADVTVTPLKPETAGGKGEQICIRFRPDIFERIINAAAKEGTLPSPWIRAIVAGKLQDV